MDDILTKPRKVTVEKAIPVSYDLGNLAVFDTNVVEKESVSANNPERETYLKNLARDNTQLLINQILSLPIKTTTDSAGSNGQTSSISLIQLPEPTSELPREKPLPKPKEPTKWEIYAARKNIKSKEKSGKLVYDEDTGEWVPKWGYKGANKKLDNQWLVEVDDKVKGTEDELIDPRSLNRAERKRLVKKNELQHKKNLMKK